MTDVLRKDFPFGYDKKWDNVTVDDLLRHRSGLTRGVLDIDVLDASGFDPDYLKIVGVRADKRQYGYEFLLHRRRLLSLIAHGNRSGRNGNERAFTQASYGKYAVQRIRVERLSERLRDGWNGIMPQNGRRGKTRRSVSQRRDMAAANGL